MINLIKADLYRIFRGKGIYITLAFLFLLCFLQTIGEMASIGITSSSMEGTTDAVYQMVGSNVPFAIMSSIDNMLYILLPVIIFISAVDFSSGAAKNVLASGVSRTQYYFSKLILSMLFCLAMAVGSIVIPTVIVSLFKGFGGSFDRAFIRQVLTVFGLQLFLLLTVTSIGTFFAFATRSTAKVNGLYLAFCLLPLLFIVLLFGISESFAKLMDYELVMNIRRAVNANSMAPGEIARIFSVGSVYLLLSIIGGLAIFRKCDIK